MHREKRERGAEHLWVTVREVQLKYVAELDDESILSRFVEVAYERYLMSIPDLHEAPSVEKKSQILAAAEEDDVGCS